MIALLFDPNAWLALATLTALEVVLGIDNLVFISLLTSRCEPRDARRVRQIESGASELIASRTSVAVLSPTICR